MSEVRMRDGAAWRESPLLDVLVVDDERANRTVVADIIRGEGHHVEIAASGSEASSALAERDFDLVVSDIRMPGMSGLELLEAARRSHPDLTIILMTAYATVASAVEAMQMGAFDYLQKPFSKEELIARVRRVAQHMGLVRENRRLRATVRAHGVEQILGQSAAIATLRTQIQRVARSEGDVLVVGESGTGKELVARALHFESRRQTGPFVAMNCAAIAEGLAESELFGHRKGAFTHATEDRAGRFEQAQGGTLFLDEISAMPPTLQPKLLRVLQERALERVGSDDLRQLDVRIVAASNRDLRAMAGRGEFREDLFHRLNVLEIDVPTLRARREDVEPLARVFASRAAARCGLPEPTLDERLLAALRQYPFPGNVRELEHLVERMVVMADADTLTLEDLPNHVVERLEEGSGSRASTPAPLHDSQDMHTTGATPEQLLAAGSVSLSGVEERLLREAIRLADGNLSEAARRLGISYKTMRYRVRKFGIDAS